MIMNLRGSWDKGEVGATNDENTVFIYESLKIF